jgi:hypothetical protein
VRTDINPYPATNQSAAVGSGLTAEQAEQLKQAAADAAKVKQFFGLK